MKRISLFLLFLLASLAAFAQSGRAIYNRYSDAEGVSAVYISPAMFRLIGRIPELNVGDDKVDLTPVIRSLSGLYIISGPADAIGEEIHRDVLKMAKSGNYELLMEAKDDGQTMKMYSAGTEQTVKGFLLSALDGDECTFICLDGEMPRKEFEALIATIAKDGKQDGE